jgi:hypothetical protein
MSNNDIVKNRFNVGMVDNFEKYLINNKPFVVNTDVSSGFGIHYIVLCKLDNNCYICDSLGKNNYRPYDNIMLKTIKNNGLNCIWYPFKFQVKTSVKCGWWSIFVCKLIQNLQNKSPQNITENIKKFVGKTAEISDENVLIKFFGCHKL